MFNLLELRKKPEGITFEETLDLKENLLSRNSDILDIKDVVAKGTMTYQDGLYLLTYDLSYLLTLASSRSMMPVELPESYQVSELFIAKDEVSNHLSLVDDELVLIAEEGEVSLAESVSDNIILNIPLQVLTAKERQNDTMPSGQSWSVLTEEQYQKQQEEKKETNNPFSALNGLFDQDSD